MNIAESLELRRRHHPDRMAVLFEDRSYTYRQIDELVNRAANSFRALGVQRGTRAGIFLPNIPEFVICYFAIQKIGGIAVSLNVMLKLPEVRFILGDSNVELLITTAELREQVPTEELRNLKHVVIAEGKSENDLSLSVLMEQASTKLLATNMEQDDPAAILYTSGTTGFPKGATLSHGNVLANARVKTKHTKMGPNDRLSLFLPMFHCFGQNAIMNAGFHAGSTLVIHRRWKMENTLEEIKRHRVTMFFGVPTLFANLLSHDEKAFDWRSVRYCFTAAAAMPEKVARAWHEKTGHLLYEGYGLTETSPSASYNHDCEYRFGTIGTPVDGTEMRVVDPGGEIVKPGELGEIVIKGPNVMLGYWGRPDETARAIREGWFHSGDIGIMDDRGYFSVCDRLKDMINVAGFKVYPAEVENVLYSHSAVSEIAVFGVPDSVKGEAVKAHVVLKSGTNITGSDLSGYCESRLANYKIPVEFKFVTTLPKNASGKILKRVLRGEPYSTSI